MLGFNSHFMLVSLCISGYQWLAEGGGGSWHPLKVYKEVGVQSKDLHAKTTIGGVVGYPIKKLLCVEKGEGTGSLFCLRISIIMCRADNSKRSWFTISRYH